MVCGERFNFLFVSLEVEAERVGAVCRPEHHAFFMLLAFAHALYLAALIGFAVSFVSFLSSDKTLESLD